MENSFNGLYQCTFEYQINNFWKILKESLNNWIKKNDSDIHKENIVMLFNFIHSGNKTIRKLSYLSLCTLLYFRKARNIFYNLYGILERNGLIILNSNIKNDLINNFIKKTFNKKNLVEKIYSNSGLDSNFDFIWYFDNSETIKIITLSKIKEIVVNENLDLIFDSNKTISGIICKFDTQTDLDNLDNYLSQNNKKEKSVKRKSKSNDKRKKKSPKLNNMFIKNYNNNNKKNKNLTINNYYGSLLKNSKISNKFVNNNLHLKINNKINKLDKIVNYKKKSFFEKCFPLLSNNHNKKAKSKNIKRKKKDTSLNKSKISCKTYHKKNKSYNIK